MVLRLVLVAALLLPNGLLAQDGDRPAVQFGGVELTVGGRLQAQLNTTDVDDEPPSQMFIRRARIELGIQVNDVVSGTVSPDFAGDRVELKDAYAMFALHPAFRVLAGNAYRPFGLMENTSSKRILPIERGLRIRGLAAADEYSVLSSLGYSNRDIGLQILGAPEGAPLGLSYTLGILRGPLHGEVGPQDSYQYAGRVTLSPASDLRVGAGWSSRHFAADASPEPELERGHAFEIDLEYGSFNPGFHLLAEFSRGDLDPFTGSRFSGAHAWAAYRTRPINGKISAVEPIFRASYAEMNVDEVAPPVQGGTLLTPGINIYLGPLSRVMLNYDVWMGADNSPDAQSWKAMFQVAF